MSLLNDVPIGNIIYWWKDKLVPEGWVKLEDGDDFIDNELFSLIKIKKVDNLTWIEDLAKKKNLI